MSWANPLPEDREFVASLLNKREPLVEFAQVMAIAPRIDNHLLRHLREAFKPDSPVKLELELWHSCELIHTKNSEFATMRAGIARLLFDDLRARQGSDFSQIKEAVKQYTAHWSEQACIERDYRWAVAEQDIPLQQLVYQRILKTLTVTEQDAHKRELARWAKRLLLTYAPKEAEQPELEWLLAFVSASLGAYSPDSLAMSSQPPKILADALPKGRESQLALRLYPNAILFEKRH